MAFNDDFNDSVPKHIAKNVDQWMEWRDEHPVRGKVDSMVEVSQKPPKGTQLPWYSYAIKNQQEWLYVPF